jgi:hypothetical protein
MAAELNENYRRVREGVTDHRIEKLTCAQSQFLFIKGEL